MKHDVSPIVNDEIQFLCIFSALGSWLEIPHCKHKYVCNLIASLNVELK